MNEKQAITQARKRWGKKAYLRHITAKGHHLEGKRVVGYTSRVGHMIEGMGDSWAEAFKNADNKAETK